MNSAEDAASNKDNVDEQGVSTTLSSSDRTVKKRKVVKKVVRRPKAAKAATEPNSSAAKAAPAGTGTTQKVPESPSWVERECRQQLQLSADPVSGHRQALVEVSDCVSMRILPPEEAAAILERVRRERDEVISQRQPYICQPVNWPYPESGRRERTPQSSDEQQLPNNDGQSVLEKLVQSGDLTGETSSLRNFFGMIGGGELHNPAGEPCPIEHSGASGAVSAAVAAEPDTVDCERVQNSTDSQTLASISRVKLSQLTETTVGNHSPGQDCDLECAGNECLSPSFSGDVASATADPLSADKSACHTSDLSPPPADSSIDLSAPPEQGDDQVRSDQSPATSLSASASLSSAYLSSKEFILPIVDSAPPTVVLSENRLSTRSEGAEDTCQSVPEEQSNISNEIHEQQCNIHEQQCQVHELVPSRTPCEVSNYEFYYSSSDGVHTVSIKDDENGDCLPSTVAVDSESGPRTNSFGAHELAAVSPEQETSEQDEGERQTFSQCKDIETLEQGGEKGEIPTQYIDNKKSEQHERDGKFPLEKETSRHEEGESFVSLRSSKKETSKQDEEPSQLSLLCAEKVTSKGKEEENSPFLPMEPIISACSISKLEANSSPYSTNEHEAHSDFVDGESQSVSKRSVVSVCGENAALDPKKITDKAEFGLSENEVEALRQVDDVRQTSDLSTHEEARADEMSRWQAVSAELRAELAQWQRKAEQSASDCSRLQTSVDQAHGEVAKLRANLASKDKAITELETKVETLNADLHRARVDNETSLKNLETACDEEKASLIQELSKAKQEALRVLEAELESRLSAQWSRRLELREQQLLTEVEECREQLKLVAEEEQLRETAVTTASHQQLVRSQSVVETLRADNTRLESSLSESQSELTRAAEQHQQLMTSARADFQLQRNQLDQQLQLVTEQLGSCEKQLQLSRDECEQLTERLAAAEQACAQSKSRSEEADNLQRAASSDLRQQLVQLLAGESSYSGDIEQLADSQLSTAAASELKRLAEERERLQLLVRERECELERRHTAEEHVLRTARADLESALVTARCELDATVSDFSELEDYELSDQMSVAEWDSDGAYSDDNEAGCSAGAGGAGPSVCDELSVLYADRAEVSQYVSMATERWLPECDLRQCRHALSQTRAHAAAAASGGATTVSPTAAASAAVVGAASAGATTVSPTADAAAAVGVTTTDGGRGSQVHRFTLGDGQTLSLEQLASSFVMLQREIECIRACLDRHQQQQQEEGENGVVGEAVARGQHLVATNDILDQLNARIDLCRKQCTAISEWSNSDHSRGGGEGGAGDHVTGGECEGCRGLQQQLHSEQTVCASLREEVTDARLQLEALSAEAGSVRADNSQLVAQFHQFQHELAAQVSVIGGYKQQLDLAHRDHCRLQLQLQQHHQLTQSLQAISERVSRAVSRNTSPSLHDDKVRVTSPSLLRTSTKADESSVEVCEERGAVDYGDGDASSLAYVGSVVSAAAATESTVPTAGVLKSATQHNAPAHSSSIAPADPLKSAHSRACLECAGADAVGGGGAAAVGAAEDTSCRLCGDTDQTRKAGCGASAMAKHLSDLNAIYRSIIQLLDGCVCGVAEVGASYYLTSPLPCSTPSVLSASYPHWSVPGDSTRGRLCAEPSPLSCSGAVSAIAAPTSPAAVTLLLWHRACARLEAVLTACASLHSTVLPLLSLLVTDSGVAAAAAAAHLSCDESGAPEPHTAPLRHCVTRVSEAVQRLRSLLSCSDRWQHRVPARADSGAAEL